MIIAKSLTKAYESTQKEIDLNDSKKLILFSDLHRGVGDWSDDFAHNKQIFLYALQHYFDQGYTYIEIGDGDELWENKNFEDIKRTYSNIFELMSEFYKEKRLHLIWGNHNRYWEKDKNVRKHLRVLVDDIKLFDSIEKVDEGVKLGDKIFITHGHQVQFLCNDWLGRKISRFLVRNIWKLLQNVLGFKDPTSPAKNFKTRNIVEDRIFNWAKEKNLLVIAGHTHRPIFYSLSKEDRIQNKTREPYYFNVGSCVHPRCITGIEIESGDIRLVKWFIDVKNDGSLFVNSKVLEEEKLQTIFESIGKKGGGPKMNESKKEERKKAAKELIKTPMEKTILFTTVFIILLIVFSLIKNRILADATIDATIIFLAVLPFIIYLAVSGKISEIRGGDFAVKLNNASNAEISLKSEEVVCAEEEIIAKGGVDMLRSEIMPKIAKDPSSTLSLVPGEKRYKYTYIVVKEYLEELTKFDFFRYVLFVDENNKFKGYIHARNLLAQLLDEGQGKEIINKINNGDVENIPSFRRHHIKDNITNREALKDMEEKGITDIAVVDRDMKFKGFTNQDMITTRIINNLMIKPV